MVIKVAVGNEEFLGENSPPSYKSLFVCKSVDSVMKNALLYGTQEYFVGGKKKIHCQNDPVTHAVLINLSELGYFILFYFFQVVHVSHYFNQKKAW